MRIPVTLDMRIGLFLTLNGLLPLLPSRSLVSLFISCAEKPSRDVTATCVTAYFTMTSSKASLTQKRGIVTGAR